MILIGGEALNRRWSEAFDEVSALAKREKTLSCNLAAAQEVGLFLEENPLQERPERSPQLLICRQKSGWRSCSSAWNEAEMCVETQILCINAPKFHLPF